MAHIPLMERKLININNIMNNIIENNDGVKRKVRARLIIDGEPDARSWWIRL